MAINAKIPQFLNTLKKGVFAGGKYRPSLFAAGATAFGLHKATKFVGKTAQHGGNNIGLYKGLYNEAGDNVMSSGKRGIDSRNTAPGLVQGLHSNRRKY